MKKSSHLEKWLIFLGLICLGAIIIADAQADQLPVVTGEHWVTSTEEEKKAFLIGMGTLIEVEQEAQSQSPTPLPDEATFIPELVQGLSQYTITEIMQALDVWYANHPDQLSRPVIEVLYDELVIPKL